VIVNCIDPGYCDSGIFRHVSTERLKELEAMVAHTSEEGARQLIWAAIGGQGREEELRGAYTSESDIVEPSDYVLGEQGKVIQDRIWVSDRLRSRGSHIDKSLQKETINILSKSSPQVASIVQKYGEF
jgi:retinol dehydrogenase 12